MTIRPARPLDELRSSRSSIKWRRYADDVLPLFVAEMDYDLAPAVVQAVTDALASGDSGYLDSPGPLAPAFARFAAASWGWHVDPARVHLATDVTVGVLEALRLALPPAGGRVVVATPVYAPFFEMIDEAHARRIEVPLTADWSLDLEALEAAFRAGADAMILCHPHNPTGRVHGRAVLERLARLAARHDVLVVSDEVHAPLAHAGTDFAPFAPLAAAAGARSVTVTSASKGWNLAALKCAVVVAGDERTARMLDGLPEELAARTSILGLHANIAAFEQTAWRDDVVARIAANLELLESELRVHAPAVRVVRPDAGYLVWLDFRDTPLGDDPAAELIQKGRVAFNSGPAFGAPGRGFARANIACDPSTIVEAVRRIAETLRLVGAASPDDHLEAGAARS